MLIFQCNRMTKKIQKLGIYKIISEQNPEAKRTSYMSGNFANEPYDGHTVKFLVGLLSCLPHPGSFEDVHEALLQILPLHAFPPSPPAQDLLMLCSKCPFICDQSFHLSSFLSLANLSGPAFTITSPSDNLESGEIHSVI